MRHLAARSCYCCSTVEKIDARASGFSYRRRFLLSIFHGHFDTAFYFQEDARLYRGVAPSAARPVPMRRCRLEAAAGWRYFSAAPPTILLIWSSLLNAVADEARNLTLMAIWLLMQMATMSAADFQPKRKMSIFTPLIRPGRAQLRASQACLYLMLSP